MVACPWGSIKQLQRYPAHSSRTESGNPFPVIERFRLHLFQRFLENDNFRCAEIAV